MGKVNLCGTCSSHANDREEQRVAASNTASQLLGVDEVPKPYQAPGGVLLGAVAQVGPPIYKLQPLPPPFCKLQLPPPIQPPPPLYIEQPRHPQPLAPPR